MAAAAAAAVAAGKASKKPDHSSIEITMDIYTHFFDKHDKKMVDTLEMIQGGQKVENFK